jgi:hypothetical protein
MGLQHGTVSDTLAHAPVSRRDVNARWSPSVQREVVAGFRGQAGRVANSIIAEVKRAVPGLGAALSGPVGGLLPSAVQAVILRGIDAVLAPRTGTDDYTEMFRGVGALAYSSGCPIDTLPAAYRTGEQVMAEQMRAYGIAHRVTPEAITVLTTAVSRQVGKLCAVSVEGYENARDSSSDTVAERRARLLRMLLDDRTTDMRVVAEEAHAARWTVPDQVAAVALRSPAGHSVPSPGVLSADTLADLDGARPCLVIPADQVDPEALARAFPGWRVAVGPAVAITAVRASLGMARKAIDLAVRNLITDGPVIDCAANSLALALFSDDFLIEQLVTRRLKPLDDLTPRQRERMLVTLHEWLAMRGRAGEVAERLGVHPQTVRYRVHQLEELFSDQLADPRSRFELEIAVRAELLRTAASIAEVEETAEAC